MATIGLDKLFYAKITEDEDGNETYSTPTSLAKAMTAELSVELAEATLYADDGAAEIVKEFQSGTLALGVADIGPKVAEDLTGAKIDDNKVLVSASEDGGDPVAVGFRAKKANGKYRYFWLYRVKFGIPATNLTTKGESIEFSTPTMEDASDGAGKLGSGLSAATVAMGNLISSGIQAALNGIKELGSAIWNLDEATEEYRTAQGKLTTAFEAAGYSGEAAQKSYTEFYKILGDTDTATEASQLLAQLAENEQDITKWTNIAAGVCGTFGDALPIEGLIESANETAKVGQVTGSLADALNWVGISEDEFNEKLAACSGESERNRLIMETLSGTYDEASQAFYRNNEALVASREGQARMDETLAGLGETISNVKNNLQAEFLPAIADVVSSFTDMVNGVEGADTAFAEAITGLVDTAVSMLPQFVSTGTQMFVSGWSGTSAGFRNGQKGRHFRMNITNPASEKTYLKVTNDGSIFSSLGERIAVGGWMNPTTYSIGNTYTPIFNTRQGPGQPIFYLSLIRGKPRIMLYNSSGALILDESVAPPFSFANNGWYFLACVIEPGNKKAQYVIGDRESGAVWVSAALSFTGELNRSCTADLIMGMNAGSYWYAGGFDDWFLDCDSQLTAEGLADYFRKSLCANGGDTSGEADALTEPGCVTLRKGSGGAYPETGQLLTAPAECLLAGTGRVSVKSEYTAGVTAVSLVETSTSDDLEEWTAWQAVGSSGELQSPNQRYIRYRVTFTTTDTSKTPKLMEIQLHDIPKPPYERLGFARPVVLDGNGAWEAVLENAFDIMVTSEVNGADTLEFKLPFRDSKRPHLDNEKQVQIVNDVYRIRTLTDDKGADGKVVTSVYAEAAFYDLAFSVEKAAVNFNADTAEAPMAYALEGTDWSVGNVTVRTKRTWQSTEKNALSILRQVQNIHGGDLIFDCANHLVHLLTFGGTDSGVLFAYRKNMKSIQRVVDTRSLVTRLYAYGKDGMTFASINGGKEYVESYAYTDEVRTSTLDCSSFTNPYQMLEFAEMRLADYAKPRISYVLSAMDLSVLTGYEHETWDLGDIVTVDDRDLNLSVKTRIVRRQYNLQEPWNTVLELSTTLRELGDSSAQWDKAADVLSNTDVIDRQEVKDMVPFNHLRNSRADSGMSYWLNSGFEVDAENGVSGTASFKCVGAAGMTKSLAQTVYPASRNSYTFSAQIASENLKKGAGGQVGIEVTFEYEDGTTETRFIDLL